MAATAMANDNGTAWRNSRRPMKTAMAAEKQQHVAAATEQQPQWLTQPVVASNLIYVGSSNGGNGGNRHSSNRCRVTVHVPNRGGGVNNERQ